MTHSDLVERARAWLCMRWPVVVTELAHGMGEEADAIGFRTGLSALVECKASRSDFLSDRRKRYRIYPEHGMGCYRYYLGPESAFGDDEPPETWGVLRPTSRGVRVVRHGRRFTERNLRAEQSVLISCLRRLGGREGLSVRSYTHETKRRATLSVDPGAA